MKSHPVTSEELKDLLGCILLNKGAGLILALEKLRDNLDNLHSNHSGSLDHLKGKIQFLSCSRQIGRVPYFFLFIFYMKYGYLTGFSMIFTVIKTLLRGRGLYFTPPPLHMVIGKI